MVVIKEIVTVSVGRGMGVDSGDCIDHIEHITITDCACRINPHRFLIFRGLSICGSNCLL